MPTTTSSRRPAAAPADRPSSVRRVLALGRLELTMLLRNRAALFNAVALSPFMVLVISSFTLPQVAGDRSGFAVSAAGTLLVFALLFAGYYTLCTTAVARREELMLKRLTTGELTRTEVLVATSVPSLTVVLVQLVVGAVAIGVLVAPLPVANPVLVLLGVVLGFVVVALLGYASSAFTRSVEAAQITTLLPLAALVLLSGAALPLALMPEVMQQVALLTPMAAVNDLVTTGLTGTTLLGDDVDLAGSFVAAVRPVLVLLGWSALGAVVVRGRMPWEPRR